MKKILFTGDTLNQETRDLFKTQGFEITPARYDLSEDNVACLLQDCDGYILGGDEIASKSLLSKAGSKLKGISFFGAGYEKYIDIDFAKSRGILVTNTPGANAESVAEFTVALLLSTTKNIVLLSNDTKNGVWNRPKTTDISGKTIGIVGLGNIGSKVANILHHGFNCSILYTGNSPKPDIDIKFSGKFVELTELLQKSDIILLHASYNEKTKNMIASEQFKIIKSGAILINTARAELVVENDLEEALRNGTIKRAAFDGFYEEPVNCDVLKKHPLLSDDRFIITPHMAYYTQEAIEKMEKMALENIFEVLTTGECRYIVNR